jgi:hypothetical protein
LDVADAGGHANPASHTPHSNEPLALNAPAGHIATVALVAPDSGQMNPALQLLHAGAPATL